MRRGKNKKPGASKQGPDQEEGERDEEVKGKAQKTKERDEKQGEEESDVPLKEKRTRSAEDEYEEEEEEEENATEEKGKGKGEGGTWFVVIAVKDKGRHAKSNPIGVLEDAGSHCNNDGNSRSRGTKKRGGRTEKEIIVAVTENPFSDISRQGSAAIERRHHSSESSRAALHAISASISSHCEGESIHRPKQQADENEVDTFRSEQAVQIGKFCNAMVEGLSGASFPSRENGEPQESEREYNEMVERAKRKLFGDSFTGSFHSPSLSLLVKSRSLRDRSVETDGQGNIVYYKVVENPQTLSRLDVENSTSVLSLARQESPPSAFFSTGEVLSDCFENTSRQTTPCKKRKKTAKENVASSYKIMMVVGGFKSESTARDFMSFVEHKSRGMSPKAAWCHGLAKHFNQNLYGDKSIIFPNTFPLADTEET